MWAVRMRPEYDDHVSHMKADDDHQSRDQPSFIKLEREVQPLDNKDTVFFNLAFLCWENIK